MTVFLSHVSAQHGYADSLARALAAHGVMSWYAPRDIRPGSIWDEEIANAIHNCDRMVLIFSAAADQSPHVKREMALADRFRKPVYWVRVEDVQPVQLAYYLSSTQWVDWHGGAKAVAGALLGAMQDEAPPRSTPTPPTGVSRRGLLIGAGAVGLAAVGGVAWWASSQVGRPQENQPAASTPEATVQGLGTVSGPAVVMVRDYNFGKNEPSDLAFGADRIYVACNDDRGLLGVIDPSQPEPLPSVDLKCSITGVAVNAPAGHLYVLGRRTKKSGNKSEPAGGSLWTLDLKNPHQNLGEVRGGIGQDPFRVAADPERGMAYVSGGGSNRVAVVDVNTQKVKREITVGDYPAGMAIDPLSHRLVVTCRGTNEVYLVDPDLSRIEVVPVGSYPYRCVVDAAGAFAYVANAHGKTVSVIDLKSAKAVAEIEVGVHPGGVCIDEKQQLLYVSNSGYQDNTDGRGGGTMSVISLATRKRAVPDVIVGRGPTGVIADDRGRVYVANRRDFTVKMLSSS